MPMSSVPRISHLASGSTLHHYDQLASTSLTARTMIESGTFAPGSPPIWIVADVQTDGTGRRGRAWLQRAGDFAGTLVLAPEPEVGTLSAYSFIAALGVRDAITGILGPDKAARVETKWPNDILVDGKKIAGLLLDLHKYDDRMIIAIGIGINIVSYPDDTPYPATALINHGVNPEVQDMARALDLHMRTWISHCTAHGFSIIRDGWLERAAGLGTLIKVRLSDRELSGTFISIDEHGALIIERDGSRETISTGDVFLS